MRLSSILFASSFTLIVATGWAHLDAGPNADGPAQLAVAEKERQREQLRLLYVALTRARHALWLGLPGVQVGRHARITRAVVDRDCVIPDGLVIGEDAAADAARFYRTESGITLVTRDMLRQLM